MTFEIPKVRVADEADDLAVKIHLFRNAAGEVCGWYIGPLTVTSSGLKLLFLPRSRETCAAVAIVRAIAAARERRTGVCLVDPHDLWEPAWSV